MKAKKIVMWVLMFFLLTVYTLQLSMHYDDNALNTVHAASPRDIVDEEKQVLFARVIDRLTIRKEQAENQCNTNSGAGRVADCETASIFARLILILSSHVS
jgi:hypothetical protein